MRALIAFLLLCVSVPAFAQQIPCAPYERMAADLAKKFKERPIGGGLVSDATIVQVFASIDGKTFTILTVNRSGLACALTSGTYWEVDPAGEAL